MPMWAVGNSQKARGFTLLELLVVLTIIALGTAGVAFAFRDNQATLLEREAERLSVILETARVQSRSSGVALVWLPLPQGFVVLPASALDNVRELSINPAAVSPWLSAELRAQVMLPSLGGGQAPRGASRLLLGAEPMIAPAAVLLSLGDRQLRIATDGLRPFAVQSLAATSGSP
jgi:general secretion pathway protein H